MSEGQKNSARPTRISARPTRTSLEVIAPSVEEAIANGLSELGLDKDSVDIEVLDEGSKGVFGIGSRQTRVRLTIKLDEDEYVDAVEPEFAEGEPDDEIVGVEVSGELEGYEPELPTSVEASMESAVEVASDEEIGTYPKLDIEEEALHIARETVIDLLDRMHIDAEVESYYAEPDDAHSRSPVWVDVNGDDLSILIGHRAETLNALQYITNLIVCKELGRSVPLVVDIQGYRARRQQEVRRLARSMADQAVKTGRRQYLEPMPANERRLAHIELRKDERVTTRSIGEDPRRKVTITPVEPEGVSE
ncbi:MAG: RNA-binding cell elongation regulator Jag/EloR [Chloroflexota bacterium]|nr:RNA-binding cell elongation regulator Jag/EloR [Chloroflexota bacterium]